MRPFSGWRGRAGHLVLLVALGALVVAALAAADTGDPRVATTKVDQAHAQAFVLRAGDLGPGWTGSVQVDPSVKIPTCPTRAKNNGDLTLRGHAESAVSLDSAGILIDADVEIFTNARQVDRLFKRVVATGLESCLRYDMLQSVVGTKTKIVSVKPLKLRQFGTNSADYRLILLYNGNKVLSDYLFVAQGRVQFFVNVVSPGRNASLMPGLEARVAAMLAARAAHA